MNLTIVTPSFNRGERLHILYNSLNEQTSKEFKWMIIDDGSTDNTYEIVEEFINTSDFSIKYFYKTNGGKHTAINFGLNFVDTELVMIVDSDDYLTIDAVETIIIAWKKNSNKIIGNMLFLKQDFNGNLSGAEFKDSVFIENYNKYVLGKNKRAEFADVWVTEILKDYPYPVYNNEKYVAESTIWTQISRDYQTLFVNKVIYIFEYQGDGLTSNGRVMRLRNPKGSMENALAIMESDISFFLNIKNTLLYTSYGIYSENDIKTIYTKIPHKQLFCMLLPLSFLVSKYWRKYNI